MQKRFLTTMLAVFASLPLHAQTQEGPDIASVAPDLIVPEMIAAAPAAGKRVRTVTAGWEGSAVHHALFLPPEWTLQAKLPVLIELPGNGPYRNAYGDTCDGSVAGCRLGYGISGGRGMIWVSAPLVEITPEGVKQNAVKWWGNVEESKRYLTATVKEVCAQYGGDAERVVLCGFSRGSIGCHYLGLNDDAISGLWRALICHSHFDGVIEKWPYRGANRNSALERLKRLGDRPEWISHERSTAGIEAYLHGTGVAGKWTFAALPYRNHTSDWVLRPIPERAKLRAWLEKALK